MTRTLSKSDYKLARTCITKLYYRELGYPDVRDDNEYLALLAEGGYMIEQLARLRYPDGIEMIYGGDAEQNAAATAAALRADQVTLFEATLLSGRKQARVDILCKRGNHFDLIEVKSTSLNVADCADNPAGPFRHARPKSGVYPIYTGWMEYLEDVTYQTLLLRELYPRAIVTPYLMVVDSSALTSVDRLPEMFRIDRNVLVDGRVKDLDVRFIGDRNTPAAHELLVLANVAGEVAELAPMVAAETARFTALYDGDTIRRQLEPVSWHCRNCEFHLADDAPRDGFRECWEAHGRAIPEIFGLYSFGTVKLGDDSLGNVMIDANRTALSDVDPALLVKKDGSATKASVRQLRQIECARTGQAWIAPELAPALASWTWPIHFIDFETSAIATPYHAGMRAYEMVGFQWSCHAFTSPDASPIHSEWLNTHDRWPCEEFAETLRATLGNEGTVLTWTTHEGTTLTKIVEQLDRYHRGSADLRAWIDDLLENRIVDMNRLCLDYFMHPGMGGRTSIKVVLDALWKSDPAMRERFAEWMGDDAFEVAADAGPYKSLPTLEIAGTPLEVAEGTGAMRAYQAIMYGAERSDAALVSGYRELLLRYCKLDTLAMVLIWDHWRRPHGPCGASG